MATISLSNVARILNLREMSGLKPRYLFKFYEKSCIPIDSSGSKLNISWFQLNEVKLPCGLSRIRSIIHGQAGSLYQTTYFFSFQKHKSEIK